MSCSLYEPEAPHEALIDPSFFKRLTDGGEILGHEDAPADWTREADTWTVTEIASRLTTSGHSVSVATVRGWCESGDLRTMKTSERGHYRIAAQDLRDFLDAR